MIWAIQRGPQWLRRIVKEELEVTKRYYIILFEQAGLIMAPEVAEIVLADETCSTNFVSWVASQIQIISQKKSLGALRFDSSEGLWC